MRPQCLIFTVYFLSQGVISIAQEESLEMGRLAATPEGGEVPEMGSQGCAVTRSESPSYTTKREDISLTLL